MHCKAVYLALQGALLINSGVCIPAGTGAGALGPNGGITDTGNKGDDPTVTYCGSLDETAKEIASSEPESGPGFWITNQDSDANVRYFLYENGRDDHPWKYANVPQGQRFFIQVCSTWQGRIVRGTAKVNLDGQTHLLGSWFENNVDQDGAMWGDISFLEGCDGGGSITATDGSNVTRSCMQDMLAGAPSDALAQKQTGTNVIDKIVGDAANSAAKDWDLKKCSADAVWIDNANSKPAIKSTNGRFDYVFYKGKA
ncbi:hypothetical protein F5Y15DRAFT_350716 [Xylariaceae sp. FL0016]|nr:hypothetical protein F5Y15DRAFT_350716 [Xylariaceae sp. FL0016]